MITQEEYEEAQEIVWDYEDQLKEQGKALDTNESNLPLHGVMLSEIELDVKKHVNDECLQKHVKQNLLDNWEAGASFVLNEIKKKLHSA
tara:strand:+ start:308 stop:574 length:267 start_codon:yes stop_codon:yes gene_type:complete